MNVPGFTAEASFYVSRFQYRSSQYTQASAGLLLQGEAACVLGCAAKYLLCAAGSGPFGPILCLIEKTACIDDCAESYGGGGGGGSPYCSTRTCPPLGDKSCCSGLHCCDGRCYPNSKPCP